MSDEFVHLCVNFSPFGDLGPLMWKIFFILSASKPSVKKKNFHLLEGLEDNQIDERSIKTWEYYVLRQVNRKGHDLNQDGICKRLNDLTAP